MEYVDDVVVQKNGASQPDRTCFGESSTVKVSENRILLEFKLFYGNRETFTF